MGVIDRSMLTNPNPLEELGWSNLQEREIVTLKNSHEI